MHRIDRSLPVLFGILTGLAGLCSPMFAPPASASAWLENPNVLVEVGGKPSGTTHVYDSEDFQQMLLVGDGQPTALVIDLTTSSVSEIPAARVQETADGANTPDDFAGELLVTDVEQQDGTILLSWGDAPVAIRPLPPLIGPTTLERILAVKPAYGASAAAYKPDPAKVAALKQVGADTEIRVYFGTWCLNCKHLVPPLLKTVEAAANPKIHLSFLGVDEDLTQPAKELDRDHVSRTPTVLVLQGGRELGRIEEKAETTVEGDLAAILGGSR